MTKTRSLVSEGRRNFHEKEEAAVYIRERFFYYSQLHTDNQLVFLDGFPVCFSCGFCLSVELRFQSFPRRENAK